MNTIIVLFLIGLLYWRVRYLYLTNLYVEYSHKLYKLRDKLRMEIIQGNINKDSLGFRRLDFIISTFTYEIKNINITVFIIFHKWLPAHNPEKLRMLAAFNKELEENEALRNIKNEMMEIQLSYVSRKSLLFHCCMYCVKFYSTIKNPLPSKFIDPPIVIYPPATEEELRKKYKNLPESEIQMERAEAMKQYGLVPAM